MYFPRIPGLPEIFPADIAFVKLPMAAAILENEFFGELRFRVRHDIRAMAGGSFAGRSLAAKD